MVENPGFEINHIWLVERETASYYLYLCTALSEGSNPHFLPVL